MKLYHFKSKIVCLTYFSAEIVKRGGESQKSRNEPFNTPFGPITNKSLQNSEGSNNNIERLKSMITKKITTKKVFDWRTKQERMQLYNMQKHFEFKEIKRLNQERQIVYAEQDTKGPRKALYLKQIIKDDLILNVVTQTELELLQNYEDRWPLLMLRKSIGRTNLYIKIFAGKIIHNKVFENFCILVIVANSVSLAMEDPLAVTTTPIGDFLENVFLALYSVEMVLKILAMGFLFAGKGSYLRDPWNMLDFTIVMSAYLTVFQTVIATANNGGVLPIKTVENAKAGGFSLNSLRAFRVLRPLRAITSIKGLQVLVSAVLSSLPLLQDTILVLLSFFLVFAIAGTQLLTGVLKLRCFSIEQGTLMDKNYLCGGREVCPEGYFCGKSNMNPNYGVTNFDNLLFSLLVVFQCITLEGWSDIQAQFQAAYSEYSIVFFLSVVLIGAFFLINLLLAVINSSFGVANKAQQAKIQAENAKKLFAKKKVISEDNFDEDEPLDSIGIRQFWLAKRAAIKMIGILRAAQAKAKEKAKNEGMFGFEGEGEELQTQNKDQFLGPRPIINNKNEEEEEENFEQQVNDFLDDKVSSEEDEPKAVKKDQNKEITKYAVSDLRVEDKINKKFYARKRGVINHIKTTEEGQIAFKLPEVKQSSYTGPMSDLKQFDQILDLTRILKNADREDLQNSSFLHPFDLSQNYSQVIDYEEDSEDEELAAKRELEKLEQEYRYNREQILQRNKQDETPDSESSYMSSIIRSDISFQNRLEMLDEEKEEKEFLKKLQEKILMLNEPKQKEKEKPTTKQDDAQVELIILNEGEPPIEISPEAAIKGKKKKKKKQSKKKGKSDSQTKLQLFQQIMKGIEFPKQKRPNNAFEFVNKKTHKIEILTGMPYLSNSMNDVYEIRNKINEKFSLQNSNIYVKANVPLELFEQNQLKDFIKPNAKPIHNAFQLKTCYKIEIQEEVEFDDDDDDNIILALQPYDTVTSVSYGHLLTQKPIKFVARRSDLIVSSTLQLTLSPSDSGYRPLDQAYLTPAEIYDWCHQRDLFRAQSIKTATLHKHDQSSISQLKSQKKESELYDDDLPQLVRRKTEQKKIDESNIFQRLKSLNSKNNTSLDKQSLHRLDSAVDSVELTMDRSKSVILGPTPKKVTEIAKLKLIPDTLLQKPLAPEKVNLMSEEERRVYNIQKGKYDTYLKICKKKEQSGEHPKDRKLTLQDCPLLLVGGHHEQEEVEADFEIGEVHMNYLGRDETFKKQKIEQFEKNQVAQVQKRKNNTKIKKHDYIPNELKVELDLPDELLDDTVNFDEVLKRDCNVKRKTPYWSGQEVLQIGLTTNLSYQVISQINAIRVWPKGILGMLKKARVFLKIIVKNNLFGNFMTFCVLLNTIAMGMDKYNLDEQTATYLESAGQVFTYIFIGEMSSKLIAIGPSKYLKDKMNWLDGGVVSLSIIEILMTAIGGGGGNLSAFRTVRVFRTFRVLRVARLLRALKSMQVILAVIQRSASSFLYITLLMFVFIFIYTLLGMQVFGGQFNFPDGKPRGNYDSFIIAFLTVFQILTTENWNTVLYDSMRSPNLGQFIPVVYYVSWIFIGNYILLNLFLAILLDGFLSEDDEEEGDLEELARIEAEKRKNQITNEKTRRLKKMGAKVEFKQVEARKPKILEDLIDDLDDLSEETIRGIFMDEGIIKKKDPERIKKLLFLGIKCEKSWYIFSKTNPFRLFMYKFMKHKLFDNFIMFLIALSSFKLAADTYLKYYTEDSIQVKVSGAMDYFLNVFFLIECFTKQIAMGTIMDEGSYLRDTWNQLDGFIVFTSLLDMMLTNVDLPVIKILRLLRTLRPLRVISHNVAMKLIVNSLFNSVGAIFNVALVVLCVWTMFAIFAINIFAGKFFFCDILPYQYHTKYECNSNGGSWLRSSMNFDDIFMALQTLFNVASLEAWPDVMIIALDATQVDQGPEKESSVINGFFFIVFILIGSFFLMNFFIGVLFLKYSQAEKAQSVGYTEQTLCWIDIQKMIVEQTCPFDLMNKPDRILHPERFKYWKIVTSTPFEIFILSIIVLNIVQMGINFENAPTIWVYLLGLSDYFFTVIFVFECYYKLRAYSFRYFETLSNKFDFFIVSSSIVDILMTLTGAGNEFALGPQMARMMRVLRVTRIVRLAKKNVGLQALMQTITLSVGALFNVFLLLVLALFIFANLASFFFGDITEGVVITSYKNFTNFGQSFLLMFAISTGENWDYYMYDCENTPPNCIPGVNCGTSYAPIFYIIFVIFIQNVMLNLFILVIINQFEKYYMAVDNPITKFKKNLDVFMITWVDFTATKSRCVKLREKRLNDFFKKLPMPIGFPLDTPEDVMKKAMLKMGIKCDDGYIYFNELLYRCMRRQYGSFRLNSKMRVIELKTQYKIYQLKLSAQSLFNQQETHEIFLKKSVGGDKSVNPFLQDMYYNISFNTWLNYARKMSKRERFRQKQEVKKQKLWAEGKDFVPGVLIEPKQEIKYVQIEFEEILYITSEGEASSEEEIQQIPAKKPLSLAQLKKKQTIRPFQAISSNGKSNDLFQTSAMNNKGYKFIESLFNKVKPNKIVEVSGHEFKVIRFDNKQLIADQVIQIQKDILSRLKDEITDQSDESKSPFGEASKIEENDQKTDRNMLN